MISSLDNDADALRNITMIETDADSDPQDQRPKPFQSKLTSFFSSFRHSSAEGWTKPTSKSASLQSKTVTPHENDSHSGRSPINLHPDRRSNLSRPPSLEPTRSVILAHTAAETKALLPNVLKTTPQAPADGVLYHPDNLPHLDSRYCPKLPQTAIRVINADTIDAAIGLSTPVVSQLPLLKKPVLVLNMANAYHGGGGWLHGSLAQEEAMCYRSSLAFTLKVKYYPIPDAGGIYSPTVVVIRENRSSGHALQDLSKPDAFPVFS